MKPVVRYEYGRLKIDEEGFKRNHWKAFVKLNVLHEGKYFTVLHNGLQFNQYVGVLQVDGFMVEIHPKADKDDSDKKWKDVLLPMLKACKRLKAQTAGNALVKKQHLNLLEVYFEYFLREIEILIHAGLVKKYRLQKGNVKALKGKLEFAGHISKNLIHKERFYTKHQVYDTNHKLHQVLNCALEIVGQFSGGTHLNDLYRRVKLNFPAVQKLNVNQQVIDSIQLNRKTAPYGRALELARLIILNYSPDISQGRQKMLALLFDMNQLWEEYVIVMLRKYIYDNNLPYKVHGQSSKSFWGSNSLQPDIEILNTDNKEVFIIDTKWKRPLNKSASVQDLRQIYAYCRFWNASKGVLLYPYSGNRSNGNFKEYLTDDYEKNGETPISITHQCKMGFVSVLNSDGKLNEQIGKDILKLLDEAK